MKLEPGDDDPVIVTVKKRLGVFPVSTEYNEPLVQRIRGFQFLNDIDVDGVITDEVLTKLGIEEK